MSKFIVGPVTQQKLVKALRDIAELQRIVGNLPPWFTQSTQPEPGGPDDWVTVKPISPHAPAKYVGKILVPTVPQGPDLPLTVNDCGTAGADCLIYNWAEAGLSTNALTEQNQLIKIFRGVRRGAANGGPLNGWPLVWIWSLGASDEC